MPWYHLILDLYGCKVEALRDKDGLERMFVDLSKLMGIRLITDPKIIYYAGGEGSPSGEGLSGFAIIAESHISIHTEIRSRYASIDIYSCKEFDVSSVERYLVDAFEAREVEKRFIVRGGLTPIKRDEKRFEEVSY